MKPAEPFYSAPWAFDGVQVMLHYFQSERQAREFAMAHKVRGVLETTPGRIWRVMVKDTPKT